MNRSHRSTGRRAAIVATIFLLVGAGCMRTEVQGTYRVEIEFSRSGAPIQGTLILSSAILDVPAPTDEDRALLGEWIEGDTIDANSCFILHSGSEDDVPRNVRLFDARIRDRGIAVPIEIYRTPVQHLEITSLEFFANAIGGEVRLHDRGETRIGRIHGLRSGAPVGQRCIDDLQTFRAQLRESLGE